MIRTFSQVYESAKDWKEILNMDYESFVKKLSDSAADPRVKPFLAGGMKDGKPLDEKVKFNLRSIKVDKLKPTQKEIDLDKSLAYQLSGKVPGQTQEILDGSNIVIKAPIVTLNGSFILDGHHRWSQVYVMNPSATMQCYDIHLNISPIDMLKVLQMSIADDLGYVPTANVEGVNLLKANINEIGEYVKKNISNTTLGLLVNSNKISDIDKDLAADYIVSSVKLMRKTSSPVKGAPDRDFMPQTDDAANWDDNLKKGEINFKEPLDVLESEINEMSQNDFHYKRILKRFDEGGKLTKSKIAYAVKHATSISRKELEKELEEMDIDDIYDLENKLKIDESVKRFEDFIKEYKDEYDNSISDKEFESLGKGKKLFTHRSIKTSGNHSTKIPMGQIIIVDEISNDKSEVTVKWKDALHIIYADDLKSSCSLNA